MVMNDFLFVIDFNEKIFSSTGLGIIDNFSLHDEKLFDIDFARAELVAIICEHE